MRNTVPEAWYLVLLVVTVVVVPFIVGLLIMKIYRYFKPFEQADQDSIGLAHLTENRDGFFKIFFVGLVVCLPAFYLIYQAG
ncbi:hypothetical protein [Pseudoalteromonas sp. R3]|uniref:hypothetical protein n=1 Tax=Pseudoalteromonas sp. R3 TaxID=1709477 RepID=UPI0006B5C011|nr:hypothetical protein [Pseudoalteromonas sp. R3]AZZ98549.1 hypothetical protein ELR70_16385 [Pseudoalteromonas sp. R3]